MSPIFMKCSKHFWERVEQRDIDLSAVVDVAKKLNNAKIGEVIKGGNERTTIVASRDSAWHATFITAYPSRKENSPEVIIESRMEKKGLRIVSKTKKYLKNNFWYFSSDEVFLFLSLFFSNINKNNN
ncbi:hypothetical protein [Helicobacter cinaedi]|uniref:hypothetical protein n=1 Tax=Helicobacter cinaedi TaxID=213 RepID=UPI000D7CE4F3|nr:hypothetical protein [Helicobacter cinaedi]